LAVPVLLVALSQPVSHAQTTGTLVCGSVDGDYNRCEVLTQGNVRLVRQISRAACEQGVTWGFDPRGIWVDQGCRAEFAYGRGTTAVAGKTLVCESVNRQYRHCPAPNEGYAAVRRQLSTVACVEGRNWGHDGSGIWVTDNCRAEFVYGRSAATAQSSADSATLTCESLDGQYKYCRAATANNVRLTRQLSQKACVEEQSWGYDDAGIWVAGGCRAEFAFGAATPAAAATGAVSSSTVTCESAGGQYKYCPLRGAYNLRLEQQLSTTACVEGQSWGGNDRGVWVSDGCRAVFAYESRSEAWQQANSSEYGAVTGGSDTGTVPGWLIGTFNGYNPLYDAGMQIIIGGDGKVSAHVSGARLSGRYEAGKLVVGGVEYTVRREQDGFRTIQDNAPGNQVIYTPIR
jgi:ribosomal protein L37AE/L43A